MPSNGSRSDTDRFTRADGTALEVTADNVINLERRPREDGEGSFGGSNGGERAERPVTAAAPAGAARGGSDDTELDDLPF